jgi:serine protease AprX
MYYCKVLINMTLSKSSTALIRRVCTRGALAILAVATVVSSASAAGPKRFAKLDEQLNRLVTSGSSSQTTSVLASFEANRLPPELKKYARSFLPLVNRWVLDIPTSKLKAIGSDARTIDVGINGTVQASNFRTSIQSGAFFARQMMGMSGKGVGVAVLDSGIAPNRNEVNAYFKDFLTPDLAHALTDPPCEKACDPNGHGTHVAGTIAGDGFNSRGERAGMAPDASIIALRVLGADGTGTVDGVINALKWVLDNHVAYKIRVVNLSFGMKPSGSLPLQGAAVDPDPIAKLLQDDPLAFATKALVDAGIFVVAAGGNIGQVLCSDLPLTALDHDKPGKCDVWGGITAPGTYPWVFTAGANSSEGSFTRSNDIRAKFSSRGPAFPLQNAKPDMLAGGVHIESTSVPGSTLFGEAALGGYLVDGGLYMSLSGTSQAAAVVSGVAAQMLQANKDLTPPQIKVILEYTSQVYTGYTPLEQGAGFLNALGAVQLAQFYVNPLPGQLVPVSPIWSQHFIWGNHMMSGGIMVMSANAWGPDVIWGSPKTLAGADIAWGMSCGAADCGDNIVWGTSNGDNIVWGTSGVGDNIVWGTSDVGDNIVWGTSADGDNIVWGTDCSAGGQDCGDNIVWGTSDGDNIVWGTAEAGDNIVWGTSADGDNIVWGTNGDGDNIVWGTADGDNIVWGTSDGDNIVWGTSDGDNIVWGTFVSGQKGFGRVKPGGKLSYKWFLEPGHQALWIQHEFRTRVKVRGSDRAQSNHREGK